MTVSSISDTESLSPETSRRKVKKGDEAVIGRDESEAEGGETVEWKEEEDESEI